MYLDLDLERVFVNFLSTGGLASGTGTDCATRENKNQN
jgi:hypothetical protein